MKKSIRPTVYESGVDLWVAALMLLSPIGAAVIGTYLLILGQADGAMYLYLIGVAVLLITMAFTYPCRYTILDDCIAIRCGILFYRIPLDEIERIAPSGSWRSAPALSIRRVKIKTKRRTFLVSPRLRKEFIADLESAIESTRTEGSV